MNKQMRLSELKVSTLKRMHKEILKQIEQAHEDGNYNRLDRLIPQRNRIQVVLESKGEQFPKIW